MNNLMKIIKYIFYMNFILYINYNYYWSCKNKFFINNKNTYSPNNNNNK